LTHSLFIYSLWWHIQPQLSRTKKSTTKAQFQAATNNQTSCLLDTHLSAAVPERVYLPRHRGRHIECAQQKVVATGGLVDQVPEVCRGLVVLDPAPVHERQLPSFHKLADLHLTPCYHCFGTIASE
jgi:hypothetical protein